MNERFNSNFYVALRSFETGEEMERNLYVVHGFYKSRTHAMVATYYYDNRYVPFPHKTLPLAQPHPEGNLELVKASRPVRYMKGRLSYPSPTYERFKGISLDDHVWVDICVPDVTETDKYPQTGNLSWLSITFARCWKFWTKN
jgi:hypothetical protein